MNETRGLWRGKRTDNGEWVDGFLVKMWGTVHLQDKEDENLAVPVDPETLGECTGLTDKNSKKIFEGDIVTYGDTDNRYYGNYAVVFEQRGGLAYYGIKINDNETWQFCLEVHPKTMEVIGNIHDNPDLLKGAQNEQKNI